MKKALAFLLFALSLSPLQARITSLITLPGGDDGEIQINDGGVFGSSGTFTFDKASDTLTVGTVTISSLSPSECVETDSNGTLTTSGSACGVGGGGASTLNVSTSATASAQDVEVSSPTAVIKFDSDHFTAELTGSATAFIGLNVSSVTLLGPTIEESEISDLGTYLTESSATATYLQLSSATATYIQVETDPNAILNQETLQSGATASIFALALSTTPKSGYLANLFPSTSKGGLYYTLDFGGGSVGDIVLEEYYMHDHVALSDALVGKKIWEMQTASVIHEDSSGDTVIRYDLDNHLIFYGDSLDGQASALGDVNGNTVNIQSSIGLGSFDITGSTTLPNGGSAASYKNAYLYRIATDGTDNTVTFESCSASNPCYGRIRRVCKVDDSTNTVTVQGQITLSYNNECVDYRNRINTGGTSGTWFPMGVLKSTSTLIDSVSEFDSSILSGTDSTIITGTSGTSGNCVEWDANGDIVDAGAACGTGGGGGYNVEPATVTFQLDEGVTATTATFSDTVTLSTITANSGRDFIYISTSAAFVDEIHIGGTTQATADITLDSNASGAVNFIYNQQGISGGTFRLETGADANAWTLDTLNERVDQHVPLYLRQNADLRFTDDSNQRDIIIASSDTHSHAAKYILPESTGSVNQVLGIAFIGSDYVDLEWQDDDTGGGGGYNVEPATVTFQLDKGFTASTGTISDLTVTYGLTVGTITAGSGSIAITNATGNLDGTKVANADLGDISVSGGSWTLDNDVVAAAEMADADHGDVSWTSGVATVENVQCTTCIDLTSEVTGTLPVANGGTGATSLSANGVLYGNGTSAISAVNPVGTNEILQGNPAGAPTFTGYPTINGLTVTYGVSMATAAITGLGGAGWLQIDGSGIVSTGTPAGSGDAVLSATQTFSGANTFTSTHTIPTTTDCSGYTVDGEICYDSDNDTLYVGDGTSATAVGGAASSMDAIRLLPAYANLPSSNFGVVDTGSTQHRILYDASTDESNTWTNLILNNYQSGTVTLDMYYSMTSATSGNIIMCAQIWAISDADSADVDTESYDTANCTSATAVPGTAGYPDKLSLTMSNKDSMADGDIIAVKIYRDADAAGDTATGDLELRSALLHE